MVFFIIQCFFENNQTLTNKLTLPTTNGKQTSKPIF